MSIRKILAASLLGLTLTGCDSDKEENLNYQIIEPKNKDQKHSEEELKEIYTFARNKLNVWDLDAKNIINFNRHFQLRENHDWDIAWNGGDEIIANHVYGKIESEVGTLQLSGGGYIFDLGKGDLSTISYISKVGRADKFRSVKVEVGHVYGIKSGAQGILHEKERYFLLKVIDKPLDETILMRFKFQEVLASEEMIDYFSKIINDKWIPQGIPKNWRTDKNLELKFEVFRGYGIIKYKEATILLGTYKP